MVYSVSGQFFTIETDTRPDKKALYHFFEDLGENDILEVRLKSEPPQIYHVSKFILIHDGPYKNLREMKSADVFKKVAESYGYDVPIPVMDQEGNCVSILKKNWSYYDHKYKYTGGMDLEFLNRYDVVVLIGLNEYSVELYKKVLPRWEGKKVFLVGPDWRDYLDVLPEPEGIQVSVFDTVEEAKAQAGTLEGVTPLWIQEGLPKNEGIERYKMGVMYYDEVMTLTFMFSNQNHLGKRNLGRKFIIIDGYFRIEGIFGIWNKVFTAARYAKAKGYIPIFMIISSNDNIYSDFEGDDIWNKFFNQPEGYSVQKIRQSNYIVISPNMNILNVMRYVMDEYSEGTELVWPSGIFNQAVMDYIEERRKKFLPCPEKTLGILLRGTDYKNPLPGHSKHATVEMVVEKIEEVKDSWDFDRMYLATEDAEICREMKERYGDRISFTDQERYTVEPGQLLVELHDDKKEGEGFRLGVEYLCSVTLLAECNCLIASGACGALSEALRQNGDKYQNMFVFEL